MTSDDLFASVARGGLTALAFDPNDKPWRISTSGIASLICGGHEAVQGSITSSDRKRVVGNSSSRRTKRPEKQRSAASAKRRSINLTLSPFRIPHSMQHQQLKRHSSGTCRFANTGI